MSAATSASGAMMTSPSAVIVPVTVPSMRSDAAAMRLPSNRAPLPMTVTV